VGLWVLETACSDFNRSDYPCGDDGSPIKLDPSKINIAVNISIKQLEKPDFVEVIMGVLNRTGFKPSRLELEVTESIMLTDSNDVVDKLNRLLALGINISLDDFGSGYSNLSRLVSLPLTKIKMDGMFMRYTEDNANSKKVISSVIRIGKDLNLITLAEGVETVDHLEYLKQQGCNEVQGYYFSKPLLLQDLINYSLS
jgi:EAL domain-containing protein (putative c-di-GMP-specific phosphodiesterase class I)